MADQLRQGDETIRGSASPAADAAVGEKAYGNFHKELSGERDRSMQNSSAAENGANRKQVENGTIPAAIAEGIKNAVADGKFKFDPLSAYDKETQMSDAIKQLSERIKPTDNSDPIRDLLRNFVKADGVERLSTGDYLVREDGKESLYTPNGDRVTVNPDGTHVIKGDVRSVSTNKSGETTVTFGDGSRVTIDNEGILDVSRGKESVSFPRNHKWDYIKPDPQPWPDHRFHTYDKYPDLKLLNLPNVEIKKN